MIEAKGPASARSLGDFLDHEVVPRLSVEMVYTDPAHKWASRTEKAWKGGCPFHESRSGSSFVVTPSTLKWWCEGCQEGGWPVQYLWKLKGGAGRTPHGRDFVDLVRDLADRAGVPFPEREMTEEEKDKARAREARRSVLEVVVAHAEEVLWSPAGAAARAYLAESRGFTDEDLRSLRLGLYDSVSGCRAALEKAKVDPKDVADAAVLWEKLEGYVLIPWMGDRGRPLTLYGRWKEQDPPEGRPKNIALPGEGTKGSPLYLDRALQAGHRDLVAVEGVFDAALLQARGDTRVVAYVAASFSDLQVETLVRRKVRSVSLCGDPDGGGDRGTLSNVEKLAKVGISPYVVPRLPDGLDPDEFVLRHGIDAWRKRVLEAVPGSVFRAGLALQGVTPTSPEKERREAVKKVLSVLEDLAGPEAALDEETVLLETADRTGYTAEALAEVVRAYQEERKAEKDKASALESLQRAEKDLESGAADPASVLRAVSKKLSVLEAAAEPEPLIFSVERLWSEMEKAPTGRRSGWATVDALDVRFHAGELSILGARTGHAKTTVLVGLLWNWLQDSREDETFLFYSHEEAEVPVARRLLALASVEDAGTKRPAWSRTEIRDFAVDPEARDVWPLPRYLEAARARLKGLEDRLFVVHRSGWTADELAAHALSVMEKGRIIGGVFVDYLQRIPVPSKTKGDRRDIDVSAVARRLKTLSEEADCPVVTGAQVNREAIPKNYTEAVGSAESYEDATTIIRTARPDLHNLREGGSEQEADVVLGLLNYAADYKADAKDKRIPDVTLLEVGTLKNREGEPGRWAGLAFEGRYGLVRDMTDEESRTLHPENPPSKKEVARVKAQEREKRSADSLEREKVRLEREREKTQGERLRLERLEKAKSAKKGKEN